MTLAPNAPLSRRDTNHQTPASRIRAYSERGFPFPRARRASQPAVLHSYSTAHSTHGACTLRKSLEENHPAQPSQQASQQARQGKARQASRQASTAPTRCSHSADHWRKSLMRKCTTSLLGDFLLGLHCVRWRGSKHEGAHATLLAWQGRPSVRSAYLLVCLLTYSTGEKRRPPGARRRGGA
jgi:hypothetical protein